MLLRDKLNNKKYEPLIITQDYINIDPVKTCLPQDLYRELEQQVSKTLSDKFVYSSIAVGIPLAYEFCATSPISWE